jgi:hypothetical protein
VKIVQLLRTFPVDLLLRAHDLRVGTMFGPSARILQWQEGDFGLLSFFAKASSELVCTSLCVNSLCAGSIPAAKLVFLMCQDVGRCCLLAVCCFA